MLLLFLVYHCADHRDLHSFPTRRSSDLEIEVIVANLMAARLTVLFGASGVGKTSLLRAGVAHRLRRTDGAVKPVGDRKSTRLNSSHVKISYAVFCLKKKTIMKTLCAQLG